MTEKDIFKKFDNLIKYKSNKNVFVKNNIMTNIVKLCRAEKKRGIRAIDGFRKKLMIPDH